MTRRKQQLKSETEQRLREAEAAEAALEVQGCRVDSQLSLVGKLSEGWQKVHEFNHLVELFRAQRG